MGFDKPDLGFVVHFQRPGSVVAYYQQVGRAGRAVEKGYGFLLSGTEEDEIHDYFLDTAFPSPEVMQQILDALARVEGMTLQALLTVVNVSFTMAERALKLLELEGAVGRKERQYFRTPNPWRPDRQRAERVTQLRRDERAEMKRYVQHAGCLMEFLARSLDDPHAGPCSVCGNCQGKRFATHVPPELAAAAFAFLNHQELLIEPRKQWPAGLLPDEKRTIPEERRNAAGRALSFYGHAGLGILVKQGKYTDGKFAEELIQASAKLIQERWRPDPSPIWVAAIPSVRHPQLVSHFALTLARRLGLPFVAALYCVREMPEQKTMANSSMQARNVRDLLGIRGQVPAGPCLLVDDMIDSGWTLTLAGWLLRKQGSGLIYPFALARATAREG
jgi:ATP-dependent DNA helicase RecQ